jgi:hypothetical protein
VVEITPTVVKRYQTDRLAEKAGPKTINDEVLLLSGSAATRAT